MNKTIESLLKGRKLVVAIDFDGTIVKDKWPEIGKFRWLARPVLDWLFWSRQHELILYTCRESNLLINACEFLVREGIHFDWINENPERLILKYGTNCRKISADWYVDDRAGFLWWWTVPLIIFFKERGI